MCQQKSHLTKMMIDSEFAELCKHKYCIRPHVYMFEALCLKYFGSDVVEYELEYKLGSKANSRLNSFEGSSKSPKLKSICSVNHHIFIARKKNDANITFVVNCLI